MRIIPHSLIPSPFRYIELLLVYKLLQHNTTTILRLISMHYNYQLSQCVVTDANYFDFIDELNTSVGWCN